MFCQRFELCVAEAAANFNPGSTFAEGLTKTLKYTPA
jgi:hypothetical protein